MKKNEMGGAYVTTGHSRGALRVLLGRTEGKRSLEGTRRRSEGNIKIDIQEVVWGGMDWTDLAQDRES